MKKLPVLTVLLPVFNGEMYLKIAIDSILNQSFKDFELLVIDDGSTDRTMKIIKEYNDSRIRYIVHTENKGLIYTLNEGLHISNGEFIVRMDADDIALPERLEKQVGFMRKNPDIGAAGSYFRAIDSGRVYKAPLTHDLIRTNLLFFSSMAHPCMILRTKTFLENKLFYDPEFRHAEDYELWVRASQKTRFSNVPEVLLDYRTHENQVSYQFQNTQKKSMEECQKRQLNAIGLNPSLQELTLHYSISRLDYELSIDYLEKVLAWFKKISASNKLTNFLDQKTLNEVLHSTWLSICGHLLKNKVNPGNMVKENYFDVGYIYFRKSRFRYMLKSIFLNLF